MQNETRHVRDPAIPEGLADLLRNCVPNIDAAELLLLLADQPQRTFVAAELRAKLRPAEVTQSAARQYLTMFEHCGLVVQKQDGFQFAPKNPYYSELIRALGKLYRERPVTLVRMIYALREDGVQAFAGTFALKKPRAARQKSRAGQSRSTR